MAHGWQGAVLKLMRGRDFTLTVRSNERISDRVHRLSFSDGGLLRNTSVHPTMWVRLWFDDDGRPHQRAYTLVTPAPEAGTFTVDFVLHPGPASDWARAAQPGDTVEATVQGSRFTVPATEPSRLFVVGDPASRPAIDSLLDALPRAPATIWFETSHPADTDHTPSGGDAPREVITVPRRNGGTHLAATVRGALPDLLDDDAYLWIACDTATTRALASFARKQLRMPKDRVHALGYWQPT
ncbi:siderophore-interacting protein [Streptomyces chumphonensis]|uniref:Siderophore-interacting protein n=1 Tax=Streptomyces chumphonensis TaxID=1214925 RepID=A0A927EZ40_9ACTN|nr:siderophore-interacting protein [Streptomyces chumphonensis]MBD3932635.1 siderophore-interacting protein [Streptomyces chumphonensis]